jgi:hypothetical protein
MGDDYEDYGNADDEIEYNPDEYQNYGGEDEGGINFDDMFLEAENANSLDKYHEIIELEKDNSQTCTFSYKSYEKICLIYLKEHDTDQFKDHFGKLLELYPRVDDYVKQDTIRNFIFQLYDPHEGEQDEEFNFEIMRFMLDSLKDIQIDREVPNTGLQFAKKLYNLERYDYLGDVIINYLFYSY